MAEQRHADAGIYEQIDIQHALKRRGILAAAGAVMAGIAMKQSAQPMSAANGSTVVLGSDVNVATAETGVLNSGQAGQAGPAIHGFRSPGAVTVVPTTVDAGVVGHTFVTDAPGVIGMSPNGSQAKGLYGISGSGYGVLGQTTFSIGVQGQILSSSAANTIAVQGLNQSTGAGGIGVQGVVNAGSAAGTLAISGTNNSSAANSHGIVGTAGSGHGLIGNTNFTGGGPPYYGGLVGNAPNGAYAGLFFGNVSITGTLNGHTAIMQQAQIAVAHPDGSHRLTQAVVSPEGWMEDFGKGTLANGQANVKIDPAFATLADLSDYHVFLTMYDDHRTLSVHTQTAQGFQVMATSGDLSAGPAGAVQGAGKFGYRIVAKRKDGQAPRLAAYTFPKIEPPHIPNPPKATPPQTKP